MQSKAMHCLPMNMARSMAGATDGVAMVQVSSGGSLLSGPVISVVIARVEEMVSRKFLGIKHPRTSKNKKTQFTKDLSRRTCHERPDRADIFAMHTRPLEEKFLIERRRRTWWRDTMMIHSTRRSNGALG
jgi:hypothetical protein